eukprot:1147109-Pelagomonas_calceolata.AAC.3
MAAAAVTEKKFAFLVPRGYILLCLTMTGLSTVCQAGPSWELFRGCMQIFALVRSLPACLKYKSYAPTFSYSNGQMKQRQVREASQATLKNWRSLRDSTGDVKP